MRIVHVTPYMHPAAGGPPVVVDRLSRELASRGHELRVLTTDLFGDARETDQDGAPRPYSLEVFSCLGGNRYGFSTRFWRGIRSFVRDCDVVHIHTLWTFASLAAARASLDAGVPFLVMPHGMLDPHSVRRGWFKKQFYGRMLEWPLLRRAQGFCYTHVEEERLAAITCGRLPRGHIVELGAEIPPECPKEDLRAEFLARHPELDGKSIVLFLGRIHAKKGFDLLIPAFESLCRQRQDAHLLIVGTGETNYVESIREDVGRRGLAARVTFTGLLQGREKWGALAASDLFVLPSYQENFGLAVVEAIRSGVPVILSRYVNLWKDVVDAGAGRACEINVESVAATLRESLDDFELAAVGRSSWRRLAIDSLQLDDVGCPAGSDLSIHPILEIASFYSDKSIADAERNEAGIHFARLIPFDNRSCSAAEVRSCSLVRCQPGGFRIGMVSALWHQTLAAALLRRVSRARRGHQTSCKN